MKKKISNFLFKFFGCTQCSHCGSYRTVLLCQSHRGIPNSKIRMIKTSEQRTCIDCEKRTFIDILKVDKITGDVIHN